MAHKNVADFLQVIEAPDLSMVQLINDPGSLGYKVLNDPRGNVSKLICALIGRDLELAVKPAVLNNRKIWYRSDSQGMDIYIAFPRPHVAGENIVYQFHTDNETLQLLEL